MSLHDLYQQYHDQIQFLMIYIREAHPVDGWWFGGGIQEKLVKARFPKASTDLYDPKNIQEQRAAAGQCEQSLQYGIHTYVDEMDDRVSEAYASKPTRLYLVGLDGRVAYAGGLGPFGFEPAELEQAIADCLAKMPQPVVSATGVA